MSTPPPVVDYAGPTAPIIARAGRYYRNARYLMFMIILSMGVWFLYDGFVAYPENNRKYDELANQLDAMEKDPKRDESVYISATVQLKNMTRHDEFSILLQKLLGFVLPPVGIGLLVHWLRKSRGQVRLENQVLTLPGSPAVPLSAIDEIDKDLWDRKGIATVYYTLEDNSTGQFILDDFIYQAHPIRAIVRAIEAELQTQDQILAQAEKERMERDKLREEQERLQRDRRRASTPPKSSPLL